MRRADRLFQIIQLLDGRRPVTAGALAERLEVSERTVYRDVKDLVLSGVPIEGEAGVGYVLKGGFRPPPLMFTPEEMEARREDREHSSRVVWPLGLVFWGTVWTLAAWCELREEHRTFRADRILEARALAERFEETDDISLETPLARSERARRGA